MIIQYTINSNNDVVIGDILYCCEVMRIAIKERWVEIETNDSPPQLYFDTDGTWIGISKYCYNCGRKVKTKRIEK